MENKYKVESINNVKYAHKGHWFDEAALKFFKSRYEDNAFVKDGIAYFISSEKSPYGDRHYTIRRMDMSTGHFLHEEDNTIFAFGYFSYKAQAKREMLKFLEQ